MYETRKTMPSDGLNEDLARSISRERGVRGYTLRVRRRVSPQTLCSTLYAWYSPPLRIRFERARDALHYTTLLYGVRRAMSVVQRHQRAKWD